MAKINQRYQGKPFLRILECYVLWAIDYLSENEIAMLKEMTPKLQSIYSMQGNWQEITAAVMEMPPNMPDIIRDIWGENTDIANRNRAILTPQQFAEMFVDQNFTG